MSHTETNEDWETNLYDELMEVDYIWVDRAKDTLNPQLLKAIKSLRQSDKELILGKMEVQRKIYDPNQNVTIYEENMIFNEALDTCKSIVEETLK